MSACAPPARAPAPHSAIWLQTPAHAEGRPPPPEAAAPPHSQCHSEEAARERLHGQWLPRSVPETTSRRGQIPCPARKREGILCSDRDRQEPAEPTPVPGHEADDHTEAGRVP